MCVLQSPMTHKSSIPYTTIYHLLSYITNHLWFGHTSNDIHRASMFEISTVYELLHLNCFVWIIGLVPIPEESKLLEGSDLRMDLLDSISSMTSRASTKLWPNSSPQFQLWSYCKQSAYPYEWNNPPIYHSPCSQDCITMWLAGGTFLFNSSRTGWESSNIRILH